MSKQPPLVNPRVKSAPEAPRREYGWGGLGDRLSAIEARLAESERRANGHALLLAELETQLLWLRDEHDDLTDASTADAEARAAIARTFAPTKHRRFKRAIGWLRGLLPAKASRS